MGREGPRTTETSAWEAYSGKCGSRPGRRQPSPERAFPPPSWPSRSATSRCRLRCPRERSRWLRRRRSRSHARPCRRRCARHRARAERCAVVVAIHARGVPETPSPPGRPEDLVQGLLAKKVRQAADHEPEHNRRPRGLTSGAHVAGSGRSLSGRASPSTTRGSWTTRWSRVDAWLRGRSLRR
jgi:hypothetical protein